MGGRRIPVTRPRIRAIDDSGELPVASYEIRNDTDVLGCVALERMLAGLSARLYGSGLEPVGEQVTATASGTSKSAVSRKFVAATQTAQAEFLERCQLHKIREREAVAGRADGAPEQPMFAATLC